MERRTGDEGTVEAHLRLEGGAVISGTVVNGHGEPKPFHGWLELMDALDEIRASSREHEEEI